MADQTPDPLAAGYERLTVSRLGSLAFRETDADLLAIKALIEEVERLRAATVKPDRLVEAVATYRAAVKKANERQFSGSGAPEAILAGVALANAVDAILAEWPGESRATVQAEALRDAADAMDADVEVRDPLRLRADWLRDRADRLDPKEK